MSGFLNWWETNSITHLFFSVEIMRSAFPIILKAFPVSLFFGIGSFIVAIPGGLTLAFMKMARSKWVRWPATFYVDVVRGTPLFLQILIVFFGVATLPWYGDMVRANPWMKEPFLFDVEFTYFLRGFVVLAFNSAAYMAEIFRAGIQSISRGQTEAARSLGMSLPQAMFWVVVPQTVRRILPTLMSEFILLFKDTAMLSSVSLPEMTQRAREFAASTFNQSSYIVAAGFYLLLTIPLGRLVGRLEDKLAESEGGGATGKRPPTLDAPAIDSEHVIAHRNAIPTQELDR